MSWQKALGADPKAIQLIESAGQSKKGDCVNADGAQSMFVLIFSTRNEINKTKILPRKYNSLKKYGKLWRSKT